MTANGAGATVAVILPGGGARGAYEAGALSILLPELEDRGERVAIWCGTSVGAINAVLAASLAHRPAREQAWEIVDRWLGMRKQDVMAPILGPRLGLLAGRLAGEVMRLPGVRLGSLLDAAPLRASLDRWIDWMAVVRNVRRGVADAVCVVASGLSGGGPVAFVHSRERPPAADAADGIRYVRTCLASEHVRASAAIPLLFPPVKVDRPASAADHYIDGGTRLNSPIKPALALGAERVILVGFEPFARPWGTARPARDPRLVDVAASVLDGLLVDQVAADLHRLAAINSFFAEASTTGLSRSARAYREARGRPAYRQVSYALVAPERPGTFGEAAERVLARRYGGLRSLRSPDFRSWPACSAASAPQAGASCCRSCSSTRSSWRG